MIARERNSSILLPLILSCCLASPQAEPQAQVSITHTPDAAPALSDRAKKQLQDKLETAAMTDLQTIDVDGAPLEINGPKATSIKIEGNYDPPPEPAPIISDYVMKLRFRLINRTEQRVTGVGLEFTNTQENNTFFVYPNPVEIEPGKSKKFEIAFMTVTGDPTYLSVQLVGARLGDGNTWGGFTFRRPRRSGTPPASTAAPVAPQVDNKPRVLNSAQPRYTEEARRNHVLGAVDLRLLVGTDGAVKQVRVTKALPDGLTEQAIRAAYELRFEPARKNGEPVEYWMPVIVEFNLK